ncbi:hypothetical protein ACFLTS_00725 [Chloroflexota bacterium]
MRINPYIGTLFISAAIMLPVYYLVGHGRSATTTLISLTLWGGAVALGLLWFYLFGNKDSKRERKIALDAKTTANLLIAKFLTVASLGIILFCIIGLSFSINTKSEILHDGYTMVLLTVFLAGFSIACILGGNYITRLAIRKWQNPGTLMLVHFIRTIFFQAMTIGGLILGVIDGKWTAWAFALPFFFVAALLLVRTFPTEKKWERMLQQI